MRPWDEKEVGETWAEILFEDDHGKKLRVTHFEKVSPSQTTSHSLRMNREDARLIARRILDALESSRGGRYNPKRNR